MASHRFPRNRKKFQYLNWKKHLAFAYTIHTIWRPRPRPQIIIVYRSDEPQMHFIVGTRSFFRSFSFVVSFVVVVIVVIIINISHFIFILCNVFILHFFLTDLVFMRWTEQTAIYCKLLGMHTICNNRGEYRRHPKHSSIKVYKHSVRTSIEHRAICRMRRW